MISVNQIANSTVIAPLRETLPQIDAVILFGSTATGHARADSNVDLAVFGAASYAASHLFIARSYEDWQITHRGLLQDITESGTVYA